jgi:D-aminopeptidase
LRPGRTDAIGDVAGVRVGHATLADGAIQTGVTVIIPCETPFLRKPLAGCCVLNGFGKSAGLMQVQELGCLETPIVLTNTLSVGCMLTAQIRHALATHPRIGRDWPTVNPLVLECNDGYLNDIHALAVGEEHFAQALNSAAPRFAQGSVGAGRGMSCFEIKGGIGSASRLASVQGTDYTVGVLVLANFGKARQCVLAGRPLGSLLTAGLDQPSCVDPEHGSIIIVLATDAPLDSLQLNRLARRCGNGLARTGSNFGHGSGDVALAFTTANALPWPEPAGPLALRRLSDTSLDIFFQAAAEATEQSVIHALYHAQSVQGRDGHARSCLGELLERFAWSISH